jgi:hypothetical protein
MSKEIEVEVEVGADRKKHEDGQVCVNVCDFGAESVVVLVDAFEAEWVLVLVEESEAEAEAEIALVICA